MDEADLRITAKELKTDGFMGAELKLLIENNSQKDLIVQSRDVSVNGFMVEPLFSEDVAAGKHAIAIVDFLRSSLEENDITDITDIELSFHVFDWSDLMNSIDTDKFRLEF